MGRERTVKRRIAAEAAAWSSSLDLAADDRAVVLPPAAAALKSSSLQQLVQGKLLLSSGREAIALSPLLLLHNTLLVCACLLACLPAFLEYYRACMHKYTPVRIRMYVRVSKRTF